MQNAVEDFVQNARRHSGDLMPHGQD